MTVNKDTADGMFKTVFGKLEQTVPKFAILTKRFPFSQRKRIGKDYQITVRVRRSHGVTFKSGDDSYDAFTLNDPVTGQTKPATVSGSMCVIRERMGHKATMAALAEGEQAFGDLYGETVADTFSSLGFYQEALMLYGQTDFGVIDADGTNNATQDLTLTIASSAAGLWAQMEGAKVDVWQTGFASKRNAANDITVNSVDFDLEGADAGKVVINVTGNATELDAIVATDVIVPKGFYDSTDGHQTLAGFDKILTNTGTLFGIDASTYTVWGANAYGAGSAELSFQKMTKAQVLIASRCGLSEDPLEAYVSPLTWGDLNNNTAALRRLTKNEGTVEIGAQEIRYYGVTGSMKITPHPMVKNGECFIGMSDYVERGGVTDITFEYASTVQEGQATKFLRELENSNGFEFRGMWDNFLIIRKPRSWVKVTGIVNSI